MASAISRLPAGSGNLGKPTILATGSSTTDATFNPTYTQSITAGQTIAVVRNGLVAQIDADPNFVATAIVDPNDPNSASFSITTQSGGEIDHLKLCENDSNIDNLGVSFAMGKDVALLNKPTTINGNGDYVLSISTWDHGTFTRTFDTTVSPNNTAAGLTASIVSSFTTAGFLVASDATNLSFKFSGDMVTALRVSSSDTGSVVFCIDLLPTVSAAPAIASSGIPTATEVGMFILVVLITGSAIWMLRRKPAVERPRS
ncbi:MAG TPA: hypothetical protein VFE84_14935, partial [Patescibacteria group bacterium]|nr:hypothetical protein [Patescibacteria group bacterium]